MPPLQVSRGWAGCLQMPSVPSLCSRSAGQLAWRLAGRDVAWRLAASRLALVAAKSVQPLSWTAWLAAALITYFGINDSMQTNVAKQ